MRAMIAALAAVLIASPAAALADPSIAISVPIGAHPHNDAVRCTNPVRITMYGVQVADALTASAASAHGGIGRTPTTGSTFATDMLVQGALDVAVGALTRRASCGTKNIIDGVIGGSALLNAPQNGATR